MFWKRKPKPEPMFDIDNPTWVRGFFESATTARLEIVRDAVAAILEERATTPKEGT
jgi:hypothetical protein